MLKDYYKILRIGKNAREQDIKKAYRNLALQYHPDKNKAPGAEQHFKEILEAYQVLSDKKRRCKYDAELEVPIIGGRSRGFRRAGKGMGTGTAGSSSTTYTPWTNPYEDYNKTELTLGAFIDFLTKMNNANIYRFEMYGKTKRSSSDRVEPNKEPPVERELFLTLEELNTGVVRKVRFSRLAYGGHRYEEKILDVYVRPGSKTGTRILFSREGDRIPGNIPADVVFIVRERPHELFERVGNDLKYVVTVPLHLALRGKFSVNVPTIEGRIITIPIKDEIIRPNTVKYIARKGMPFSSDPKKRGNLQLSFKIKYPVTMAMKTRKMMSRNLFN